MVKLEYHKGRLKHHVAEADRWLNLYDKSQTDVRRKLVKHHIELAKFHASEIRRIPCIKV